jgi:hypothetical protein
MTIDNLFTHERTHFRSLLLGNENYFGNLPDSKIAPSIKIIANKTYEELGCLGFQPEFNRLEAVVYTKQPAGYGGGVCGAGTTEYVRFYLSFDNGAAWQDQGLTGFQAHDIPIPAGQRLEYDVTLLISPAKKFCFLENLPRVRAILSWNFPPPPNSPNFVPVWGEVQEANIQIDTRRLFLLKDVVAKLPKEFEPVVDLETGIPTTVAAPLEPVELAKLYQKSRDVPAHRFLAPSIQAATLQPNLSPALTILQSQLSQYGVNLAEAVKALIGIGDGNQTFEQLGCLGLNPLDPIFGRESLVGVINVKKSSGFSGGPCTAGSREYVAFWMDFGGGWVYMGTGSVGVHDYAGIPKGGLNYSVFVPVNLDPYRRPCQQGPVTARVRAILSWQVPPPPANPNWVPVWGSREETTVEIKPGNATLPGTHPPFIETVGGMDTVKISGFTGLANGHSTTAGFNATDSPFGGEVVITGHIGNPTDISGGASSILYKVMVSGDGGGTWQALNNQFAIGRSQLLNGIWSDLPDITQIADGANFFTYREDLSGGPGNAQIFVKGNILARWLTGGLNGEYLIRIEAKLGLTTYIGSQTIKVKLDNTAPKAVLSLTSGGGSCADFKVGDQISGVFTATDTHFGSTSLGVIPNPGTFTAPVPMPVYPAHPTGVVNEPWTLDTTGMAPCGYVVVLNVWDRTIVNSGAIGFHNSDFKGFCLKK